MKKSLLIAAICLVAHLGSTYAQEISYGVKAGVNLADLNVEDDQVDPGLRTGLHAGAFVNIGLTEDFSIQPELLYSMQGSKTDVEEDGVSGEERAKMDYLNLPVIAQRRVIGELFAEAGPQLGLLLSAKTEYEAGGEKTEIDIKDAMKNIDLGLVIGLAYKFPMGVGIKGRYNLGLSDINDTDGDSIKNSVIQFGLNYSF